MTSPQDPNHRRPLLLAAAGGFVLAAVIALVLSLVGAWPGSSDDPHTVSTSSLALPDKVDSYTRFEKITINQRSTASKAVASNALSSRRTAQALSDAHQGAGAAVQTYAAQDLMTRFQIWTVRDHTPRPVIAYQDADILGLAQPTQTVRRFGNSWCQLIDPRTTPKGQTPPKNSYVAVLCIRSDDDLTVEYVGGGGDELGTDPARVAAMIDEVWASIR